jgi:hypothetical protein
MCAARVEAFVKSVHAFDRRVSSCVGFRGGTRGLGGFSKPTPTKARVSVTGTRPRNNRLVVRADENGQDAYNKAMAEYSKTPFEYRHELGLYYHEILPNLIVGTQPTTKADIDRLRDVEHVTCIFDLQQEKDKEHWGVDFGALKWQMGQREVLHVHKPFVDFNADSLREGLPTAVAAMDKAIRDGHKVYCHCTAGMGRAPGVSIAYLYWCLDFKSLDEAYDFLTERRPCGPKKESIRAATLDMLAAHGESLPREMVHTWEGDTNVTKLTRAERWEIVKKLRRSLGDDPEECLRNPVGAEKKIA